MLAALRPDVGSFSKLLVWLGVFSLALAIAIPWLFLRETAVLEIASSDLARLTPRARAALVERQQTIVWLQDRALAVPAILAPLGTLLLFLGGRGLRSQQRIEDAHRVAEKDIAQRRATIEEQTPAERDQQLREAAEADVGHEVAEGEASAANSGQMAPQADPPRRPVISTQSIIDAAQRTEEAVLDRVRTLIPSDWRLRAHVKVRGPGVDLLLDGLIEPSEKRRGDIVIEVKYVRSLRPVAQLLNDAIARTISYRRLTGRRALTWLIVVVDENAPVGTVERLRNRLDQTGQFRDLVQASVVGSMDEITNLPEEPPDQSVVVV